MHRKLSTTHTERITTMTDIQTWLDQGKTLADEATEGPWEAYADSNYQPAGCPPIIEHLVYAGAVETPIIDWGNGSTKPDTEFIADARTRLPQAINALQAVLDLHKPEKPKKWVPVRCNHCRTLYPCLDVRRIQNAIKEQDA